MPNVPLSGLCLHRILLIALYVGFDRLGSAERRLILRLRGGVLAEDIRPTGTVALPNRRDIHRFILTARDASELGAIADHGMTRAKRANVDVR